MKNLKLPRPNLTRSILIAAAFLLSSPAQLLATVNFDANAILNDTPLYDPNDYSLPCPSGGDGSNVTNTTELAGSDNQQKAIIFFVQKGLKPFQAAGIVGNLMQESSLDPQKKQLNGGPGRGIAQWTLNDRWATLQNWAKSNNRDPWDLATQLEFIWYESTTSPTFGRTASKVKASTSIEQATQIFLTEFERADPAQAHLASRIKFAKNALNEFNKKQNSGENPSTAPEPTTPDASANIGDAICGSIADGNPSTADGSENVPTGGSGVGNKIVQIALGEVGNHEIPARSDAGPQVCKYQTNNNATSCAGEAWCADFVSWVYKQAGVPFTGGANGWRIAGAAAVASWFKSHGTWISNPGKPVPVNDPRAPKPGDVVFYPGPTGNTGDDHVNIVVSYDGKTVKTVGGNQGGNPGGVTTGPRNVFAEAAGWGRLK